MKGFLFIIFLVFFLPVSFLQAEKRPAWGKTKPIPEETFSISIGYNTIPALFSKTLNAEYTFLPGLHFGGSLHLIDREDFLQGQVRSPLSCDDHADNFWLNSCVRYRNSSRFFLRIFAKYFPFQNGFYAATYLGRLPHLRQKNIYFASLEDSTYRISRLSVRNPAISYTIETKNNYYLALAAGWKWRWNSLFFLSFDGGIMKELNPDRNVHFFADLRGLHPAYTVHPIDILYLKWFSYYTYKEDRPTNLHLNLSAGISF